MQTVREPGLFATSVTLHAQNCDATYFKLWRVKCAATAHGVLSGNIASEQATQTDATGPADVVDFQTVPCFWGCAQTVHHFLQPLETTAA